MKYIFLHMHIHLFYLVSEKDYPSSLNCLYIFFKKNGGPHTCESVGSISGFLSR